jgi:penicillin-binding protein 2
VVWKNFSLRKPEHFYLRLKWVAAVIITLFGLLGARLFWLQIIQGSVYRDQAENNSIRVVPQRAPRGLIYDRNLQVLAGNVPNLSLGLIPAELLRHPDRVEEVLLDISRLLKLDLKIVKQKFEQQKQRPFAPARLLTDIDRQIVTSFEEKKQNLPGAVILTDSKRIYPQITAAHVLGYVGEITQRQLELKKSEGYRMGDMFGQSGIERIYDEFLRGEDGGRQVRIDAAGRELGVLKQREPVGGNNLVLTLDLALQMAAEEVLGSRTGAIVALDPRNGEILALVSKPDFDPGIFSGRVSPRRWNQLLKDRGKPMANRALQGLYPPGSVFKLVTAASGLASGLITPQDRFECLGIYWISTWPYRCWKEIGHGQVNLNQALAESCDVYFYQVGLRVRVQQLYEAALSFGLGKQTGIDLPGEVSGLVPNSIWKEQTQHMPWFPGNTVMMSIGQGYLLTTPLQLAVMTAAVANGGMIYKPHLLKKAINVKNQTVFEKIPEILNRLDLDPEFFGLLRQGMVDAVHSHRGTAWRSRMEGLEIAGKTGTSQNPHGQDHAVFVCFAPADNPQVAIAVLVENSGDGGLIAAPMARRLLETYFSK